MAGMMARPFSVAGDIEPGHYVRHPSQPGWGLGQVQSAIGSRVTVNFEHAGKVLVNIAVVELTHADPGVTVRGDP